MPTQPLPRRILIQLAHDLYDLNKRHLSNISTSGHISERFHVVPYELELGWKLPNDFIEAIKELQKFIPSMKGVNRVGFTADITTGDITESDAIAIRVDQERFSGELISFVKNSNELKRLISRDEKGQFWFMADRRIVPKKEESYYWKIFVSVYEVAMISPLKERDFYLAEYKRLQIHLSKNLGKVKSMQPEKFMQFIRNFINLRFRAHPESLGLSRIDFSGIDILSIETGKGVKLYNPEL